MELAVLRGKKQALMKKMQTEEHKFMEKKSDDSLQESNSGVSVVI